MASVTVKKGETFYSISKRTGVPLEDLQAENRGVSTLKTGQVVNIPKFGSVKVGVSNKTPSTPNPAYFTSPYQGFQTPTTNGFTAPAQSYTGTAGYWAKPPKPAQQNFQTPTTNGFTAPTQGYTGTAGYWAKPPKPALQPPTPAQPTLIPRPTGVFTGDPNDPNTAAWRNYWNAAAANPASVEMPQTNMGAPIVMTREQIWNMKAEQRRRRMEAETNDGYSYEQPAQNQGQLVRTVTWGI